MMVPDPVPDPQNEPNPTTAGLRLPEHTNAGVSPIPDLDPAAVEAALRYATAVVDNMGRANEAPDTRHAIERHADVLRVLARAAQSSEVEAREREVRAEMLREAVTYLQLADWQEDTAAEALLARFGPDKEQEGSENG